MQSYDYAQAGMYFATICVKDRACLLGNVVDDVVQLSEIGVIVRDCWIALPQVHADVTLDEFVIMPNHVHGLLMLDRSSGDGRGLFEIIQGFKTYSARRINEKREMPNTAFWQRGYYEHIVRDEKTRDSIREYILLNPIRWSTDADNPGVTKPTPS